MLDHPDAGGRVLLRKSLKAQPKRRLAARRGATLVLVATLIVIIGGMAAFAIDLARIYSGVNEMQTGADAAALAGALRLQRINGASPVGGIQSFALSNNAFGSAISLSVGDIQGGFWNPYAGVFTPTNWAGANAVRVTTRSTPTLAFGRLLNRGSLTATRSAVAWIANQDARDCIKPWGLDVTYIRTLLGQDLTGQDGANVIRSRNQTLAGQYSMTVVASPNLVSPVVGTAAPTTFAALTSPGVRVKEYDNAMVGENCNGRTDYVVNTDESTVPIQTGTSFAHVPWTTIQTVELNGYAGVKTCGFSGPDDATCYDPSSLTTAGVTVGISGATQVAPTVTSVKALLDFKLMCVFRGQPGVPGSARPTENCPWLTAAGLPADNYVQGTIVGFPVNSVALTGPGNGLGNSISSAQKLVLVK
jgi:Flp pilus assembly protein TadG